VESQVCRLDVGEDVYATAFLVGSDLVLTAFNAVDRVISGERNPRDVACRFDYKRLTDGGVVSAGTRYRLAEKDWLVSYSAAGSYDAYIDDATGTGPGPNELNYALLRLGRPAGADPVGGDRADPNAPARRWIDVLPDVPIREGEAIIIVQHPKGAPLQIAIDSSGTARFDSSHRRIFHRVNTLTGSSGSPCFNAGWQLIGMHVASDPQREINVAISTAAILEHLRSVGFDHLLNQSLA
jgi:hypothetical protein